MLLRSLFSRFPAKKSVIAMALMSSSLLLSNISFGQDPSTEQASSICVLKGAPPSDYKYKVVKKLKLGKGSYGSVTTIQPKFSKIARDTGADAVIMYNASQRFGFFPWRFVRPVITGTAIKWDTNNTKSFSCTESGGSFL